MNFKPTNYFKWHLAFWVVYVLFKIYHEFVWVYPKYENLTFALALETSTLAQIGILLPKVVFTYWVAYKLLFDSSGLFIKWIKFVGALFITLFLYRSLIVYLLLPMVYLDASNTESLFMLNRITSGLIDILLVTSIGTALITIHRNQQAKERELILQKEKTSAELQLLRQQMNPHFLLNTLNNLFVLARKKADVTPEAILKLSKLMQFVLYDSTLDKIPLSREIEVIKDYIVLEQLRYDNRLNLSFDVEGELNGMISPTLLHPVVENAFKHGASESEDKSFIKIKLTVNNQKLTFSVENSFQQKMLGDNNGIGMKNLKRQLELQYPNHELKITSNKGIYYFSMKIDLE